MAFERVSGNLACDDVSLAELAERHGTPLYVYSGDTLVANIRRLHEGFKDLNPLIAFSIKANSNLAVIRLAVREGCGLDIVSVGELQRALRVGVDPGRVIFAGVGKTDEEITEAIQAEIGMFNVESVGEIAMIDGAAKRLGKRARIALRVNPNVKADTHKYITTGTTENKFGIDFALIDSAIEAFRAAEAVDLIGLHCHIGSQILDAKPYRLAAERLGEVVDRLREQGLDITHINFGGGHGIAYEEGQTALDPAQVAEAIRPTVERLGIRPILEPGRSLAGPAGVFVTRVVNVKRGVAKTFVIVDGAMNDLLRPSLYSAHHRVTPVSDVARGNTRTEVDIVGPVCESGDFLAKDRLLPLPAAGDLLAILDAGAYGMVMASNYNSRPRAAEILLLDGEAHVIRRRETLEDLLGLESIPAPLQ
jgi:diaminopimelate decarboxylase